MTMTSISADAPVEKTEATPSRDQILIKASGSGYDVHVSRDGGATFTFLTQGLANHAQVDAEIHRLKNEMSRRPAMQLGMTICTAYVAVVLSFINIMYMMESLVFFMTSVCLALMSVIPAIYMFLKVTLDAYSSAAGDIAVIRPEAGVFR